MKLIIPAYIKRILCCGITLGILQGVGAEPGTADEGVFSLAKIELSDTGDKTTFALRFSEKPDFVHAFALTNPNRLVIDIGGTIDPPLASVYQYTSGDVARVRVGRHTRHVRFVLDFESRDVPTYVLEQTATTVTVLWEQRAPRLSSKAASTRNPTRIPALENVLVPDTVVTKTRGIGEGSKSVSSIGPLTRHREVPSAASDVMQSATQGSTSPQGGRLEHVHPPAQDRIMPATKEPDTEKKVAMLSEIGTQAQRSRQSESAHHASSPHFRRGQALYEEGNLDAAIKQWEKALRVAPQNADAHYHKGLALEARGDVEQAITQYREATRLKPTEVSFYVQLARAYEIAEDNVAALTTYQDALILKPSSAHLHNRVGHLFAAEGKLKAAADSWRQTILHQPDYAFAYVSLADVLDGSGEKREALSLFKKALSLDPRGPFAKEVRQKITRLQTPSS